MNLKTDDLLNNNRYRIQRVPSDKGGMGVIYLASDHSLGDTVVVKQSRFSGVESLRDSRHHRHLTEAELQNEITALQKDFEREAKLLSRLRHNALPRVRDYFKTDTGAQFLVMELIPGPDLEEFLQTARSSLTQALQWADQLLDALHYLHTQFEKPIIHRDIKPQNLKLMPNGQIVLLDFGLAKGAPSGMSIPPVSAPGNSPAYSPLEQIEEQGTDRAAICTRWP